LVAKSGEVFDTVTIDLKTSGFDAEFVAKEFKKNQINIRHVKDSFVSVTVNETTTLADMEDVINIFHNIKGFKKKFDISAENDKILSAKTLKPHLIRTDNNNFLKQDIFHKFSSESQMLRYLYHLQLKDISLCNSMITLGSCTMKLNSTSELVHI
jgi:glycine dehydrogenase